MNMGTPAGRGSGKGLFAHSEDVHCVLFQVFLVAGFALAFTMWNVWDSVPALAEYGHAGRNAFAVAAAMLLGWSSGINVGVNFHNHSHRKVFNAAWMNRWFGRFWTVSGGWPAYYWEHSHVTVHHAHLLESVDWTLPKRKANGEWESIYVYALAHWPFRYVAHLWDDAVSGRYGAKFGRKMAVEFAWFVAIWMIPPFVLGFDPLAVALLWLLPQWLANVAVMAPGMYAQHAGCSVKTADEPFGHSNTFVNRFFNLTMFNIGYHIEHHDHPSVHWSELPRFHETMKARYIDAGARVLPIGYYRGGQLLCRGEWVSSQRDLFFVQHADYIRPSDVVEAPSAPARSAVDVPVRAS